jgi:hypothetical protein
LRGHQSCGGGASEGGGIDEGFLGRDGRHYEAEVWNGKIFSLRKLVNESPNGNRMVLLLLFALLLVLAVVARTLWCPATA